MMWLTLPAATSFLATFSCPFVPDVFVGNSADEGREFVRRSPFIVGFARIRPVFGLAGAGAAVTFFVQFAFAIAVGFDVDVAEL